MAIPVLYRIGVLFVRGALRLGDCGPGVLTLLGGIGVDVTSLAVLSIRAAFLISYKKGVLQKTLFEGGLRALSV